MTTVPSARRQGVPSRPGVAGNRFVRAELGAVVVVAALVGVLCQVPTWANPSFYFSDDSAAQFLPMWHRLGERMLAGDWPPVLDPDSWMGGNVAAEALFGLWNPVNLLDYLLVVAVGDLAVAATVVKTQFLVILAVGVFLLCREYGADRWVSSVLGVALPFSGFVLYFQAASWAAGLIGFAWLPWAWWTVRRAARGRLLVLVPCTFCFLCVSSGDPYGVLGLCFVFLTLLVEVRASRGDYPSRATQRVLLIGIATGLTLPLVFLPLVMTSPVTWRSGFELYNIGRLAPDFGDLVNLSIPGFVPQITSFGSFRMAVPAMYFAWFVIPLVSWLDWRSLVNSWRRCTAPLMLAGGYLLLCLGPSNVWLFRWPLRHVVVLFLALSVILALVLSHGLRTDRFRTRAAWTAGAMALCAYLSFAAWPAQAVRHLVSVVVLVGLLAVALWWTRARPSLRPVAVVLHLGTAMALALQVCWFPVNRDVAIYHFPSQIGELRSDFEDLRSGTVLQIADRNLIAPEDIESREAWKHLLFGNMHAAAGVSSLVAYTGIGYDSLHRRLCLSYYGSTCARAYGTLWTVDEVGVNLADQLDVQHVVVQRALIDAPQPPPGWRITARNRFVTVIGRVAAPERWGESRLSAVRGVTASADPSVDQRHETIRFTRHARERAELVFARLAWPGYQATMDGREVPIAATSAGLLKVRIPQGVNAGTLRIEWSPPGFGASIVLAVAGAALALGLSAPLRKGTRRC